MYLYSIMFKYILIYWGSSSNLSAPITARIPNCPILIHGLSINLLLEEIILRLLIECKYIIVNVIDIINKLDKTLIYTYMYILFKIIYWLH